MESTTQQIELVVVRTARRRRHGGHAGEARARRSGHLVAEHLQRPGHRDDDPSGQGRNEQDHRHHGHQGRRNQAGAQQLQPPGRQPRLATHQVQVARRGVVGTARADGAALQGPGRHHGVGVHELGIVAHDIGRLMRLARGRGLCRQLHRGQGDLEARRQAGLPCADQHGAVGGQQVELAVGLVEQQVAQKRSELFGLALVLVEQVVVLLRHTGQEVVAALPDAFVLKALKGQRHRDDDGQGRGQPGQKDRQRQAQAYRHGQVRIRRARRASCSPRRAPSG